MNIELLDVWDRVKAAIMSNWLDSPNYHREATQIEASAYMRGYNKALQDSAASAEAAFKSIPARPCENDHGPVVPNTPMKGAEKNHE